ncbi:hypothetical protein BCE75_101289 [Isoptericola sp. CG 20/1183]|uniref:Uncharacterized protein n=1 Tax=Isoptericola halotolerans TaxID=300560 RepID=A0ABX5EJV4_9MICO|nr:MULTISPECIES: hypothetical protein [Isoptericola]PRZ08591.1 hypothetical protein BCL65_102133 [Isoptericola halotolerans]PRZ10962.1 hypothetical protein BCE75_101289 [Isoptericola sp. CG 20/1183]
MADKHILREWVLEALEELNGRGTVVEVSQVVWRRHESDLRAAGSLFYTWQYDIRWAAQQLRNEGLLRKTAPRSRDPWSLP